ncbi:septum site-determining protein Ssd [Segniliparus rotundus]|nr:septum site-determining protein Ssd [Segniliparus rotundus]
MRLFRPSRGFTRPPRSFVASEAPEVLAAIADPVLMEHVRHVVAASGRGLVESPPQRDRRVWRSAGMVLLDEQTARACAGERLARDGATALVCTGPASPAAWQLAVRVKADHVLALPEQERDLVRVVGEAVERRVGAGRIIAVIGARGGAGVSTLVAATALVAARSGLRSLAVDLDPLGGGLDVVLGMEREPGLRWGDLALVGGRVSAAALHEALPSRSGNLSVLGAGSADLSAPRGAIEPEAALAVLDSTRSAGDAVVVDLPRHWGDLQQAVVATADSTILVLPAELRAIAAGRSLALALCRECASVGAVVRGPSPGGLRLSRAAEHAGVPLIATMHDEPPIALSLERHGLVLRARSSVLRAAAAVLGRGPAKAVRR